MFGWKSLTQATASVSESYGGWELVSRLAIFGRITVRVMPKKTEKNPQKTTQNKIKRICFEIFGIEFHLHLVKFIVMEMNCSTFNVQQFSKRLWNYFDFFFLQETYFCSVCSKCSLVDLIREKIYHDRRGNVCWTKVNKPNTHRSPDQFNPQPAL